MRSWMQFKAISISNASSEGFRLQKPTTEEVARVHLYLPAPAFSAN
jgi:hypothetical protein